MAVVGDLHLRFVLVVNCRHFLRNHVLDLLVERGHHFGWDRYDAESRSEITVERNTAPLPCK